MGAAASCNLEAAIATLSSVCNASEVASHRKTVVILLGGGRAPQRQPPRGGASVAGRLAGQRHERVGCVLRQGRVCSSEAARGGSSQPPHDVPTLRR